MTTVLAHGCFDLLHLGHIRHLKEARQFGSKLVVSVTSDRFVNKGVGRPRFTAEQRMEALRALSFVDEVVLNDAPDAAPIIAAVKPDIYVKGADYAGRLPHGALGRELEVLERLGGKFVITKADKWSSSRLINSETHSEEMAAYLERARKNNFLHAIERAWEKAKTFRVCVVGEAITDQYIYVSPLAKPSKEFVLAAAERGIDNFHGGVTAAAAHIEKLCRSVITISQPAENKFIKRRYVEAGFTRKLFEVYSSSRLMLNENARAEFIATLQAHVTRSDVVIVLDFGHGLIDDAARSELDHAKFLAANAQTNAGNQGFNLVTKYAAADYICVDAPEARLAVQDQTGSVPEVLERLVLNTKAGSIIVTHGREGSYWAGGKVPAIISQPLDTMGAGDCFMAFTAPLIAAGLGAEEAAFVGNVAGGIKTGIVGHSAAVDPETLIQTVRALLQ